MFGASAELRATDEAAGIPGLESYDFIVISSSAGKDSQAMLHYVTWLCQQRGIEDRIVVVHADLGRVEWPGTKELARRQAEHYGHRFELVSRIGGLSRGLSRAGAPLYERGERHGNLLAQVRRRHRQLVRNGKHGPAWPSMSNRWCTSDFKRGPIGKLFTRLANDWRAVTGEARPCRILDCIGLRAEESPARRKASPLKLRTSSKRQFVQTWLPVKWWSEEQIWQTIEASGVEHHWAYDLGMPRLSCVFCVFASRSALMIAGEHSPELLDAYVEVERETGFTFRQDLALADIQEALNSGQRAAAAEGWVG